MIECKGQKKEKGATWRATKWVHLENFLINLVEWWEDPNSNQNLVTVYHKKNIVSIIMCDVPWYRKMTCDNTMGKCSMGQSIQHVKIIKYATYMAQRIFLHATLNTWNSIQHFPNYIRKEGTHAVMNT
jgi:hypothetical protein